MVEPTTYTAGCAKCEYFLETTDEERARKIVENARTGENIFGCSHNISVVQDERRYSDYYDSDAKQDEHYSPPREE